MKRETDSGSIALEDLVAGRALAFAALHLAAAFSLVVNFSPSNPTQGIPATLLFDVKRFTMLYYQLDRIVGGITLLVLADHLLGDRRQQEEKHSVLTDIANHFATNTTTTTTSDNFRPIADMVCQKLDSVGLLDMMDAGAKAAFLGTLEAGFTDKNHRVRVVM